MSICDRFPLLSGFQDSYWLFPTNFSKIVACITITSAAWLFTNLELSANECKIKVNPRERNETQLVSHCYHKTNCSIGLDHWWQGSVEAASTSANVRRSSFDHKWFQGLHIQMCRQLRESNLIYDRPGNCSDKLVHHRNHNQWYIAPLSSCSASLFFHDYSPNKRLGRMMTVFNFENVVTSDFGELNYWEIRFIGIRKNFLTKVQDLTDSYTPISISYYFEWTR